MSAQFAFSFRARLRGLLGKRDFDGTLMLAPCRSIHTFGMAFPLDVAFVADDGTVIAVAMGLPPNERASCREAAFALERKAAPSPWLVEGMRVEICSTMGI